MGFPVGSVILLYNNEGLNNCYNFVANETGAGGQFFIPVGTSTLMESTSDSPTVQGTPDCDYCGATYTTPGTWGPIGLGNTADGLQVRCPGCSDEEPAMFQAISYGTGFGTVAMGTNDLGGMFSSGTGTQQTYSYTFSTCITSGTPGTWTRTTAASAGTPPDSAGVVSAAVRTQLESCSIPCCGGFEEQPDEEAVAANGRYRFGFQGQEKDDEMHGATGTSYSFEYRMHDARVCRFLSLDPLAGVYPWNSPYAFAENQVIKFVELEGLEKGKNRGDADDCEEFEADVNKGKVGGRAPSYRPLLTITTVRTVKQSVKRVLVDFDGENEGFSVRVNSKKNPKTVTFDPRIVADKYIVDNRMKGVGPRETIVGDRSTPVVDIFDGEDVDISVVPGNEFLPESDPPVRTVYNLRVEENYQKVIRTDQVKFLGIPVPHRRNNRDVQRLPIDRTGEKPVGRSKPIVKPL